MSAVYVAIPLPPFHRWRLLPSAADCPDGHAIIACLRGGASLAPTVVARGRLTLRSELSELLAIYATLDAAGKAHLIAYGRQLINQAQAEAEPDRITAEVTP